ncbi:DUF1858 domain-containing protein [Defluviitalea saccharophila]|uniref:DUF1858 domain-containing protein n=1 Tax=Defluviitalea saccharophila TaxID=879970 RepID=A0ABZ2YAG2_9FIRM|nr:DUF1858 domain-containing protein [Candidatus Epulonipiscium sp.]
MAKTIDFSKTVYELWEDNPEIIDVMKSLGFDAISNPAMLSTAGRVMTIPKGAAMKGIPLDQIKEEFIRQGYTIKE